MEGPDEDTPALVVDSGTGVLKAGFAGDDAPRVVFPTLIGTPKSRNQMEALGLKEHYVGDEAQQKRGLLSLQRPMEHGVVSDWEAMERVWQAAFGQLRVSAADRPVLMTEPVLNPMANRENMTQMMFERFHVPAFYVMTQGVLSLFASGRHMGVMLDCGEGATHVMPVEGLGREVAREVKESLCYVAEDYDGELASAEQSSALERNYRLPDGQVITLNDQRFRVPEALFQPSLLGRDEEGVHQLVYKSIMKCDIDVRSLAYSNIVLVGGSTLFPGFGARLKKELSILSPPSIRVAVVEPPERKYSVWIGGSIVASLSTFQKTWITKQQYEEHGPSIVHRKCS